MRSTLLDSIKYNIFMPFPDKGMKYGTDGNSNFLNFDDLIKKKYASMSIESLMEDHSYTTWKYCGEDNQENFELNSKLVGKDWYYHDNKVTYTFNSFGYRTKNFNEIDWSNSIVIFGCSVVQGLGVDDKHTLSYFLEQHLNMPVINMGVGGSSNEFHIHNASVLLSQYPKPKAVVFSHCGLLRYPLYDWNTVHHFGTWNDKELDLKDNRSNNIIRSSMSTNIIKNMCKFETTYIEYSFDNTSYQFLEYMGQNRNRLYINPTNWSSKDKSKSKFARDLCHPGKEFYEESSKSLAQIIKSRI